MSKRPKLPEVRCTVEFHKKVMEHANSKGLKFSQYVLSLIEADMLHANDGDEVPKHAVSNQKIALVGVLLPRDVIEDLKRKKEKSGVPVSVRIRQIVMSSYGKRPAEQVELDELIRSNNQLVALGRNLNQLTRQANMGEHVVLPEMLMQSLLSVINDAMHEIEKLKQNLGY